MYRVRQQNSLLEIEKRAALGSTSQCSHCCPLIHFLWVILLPNPVYSASLRPSAVTVQKRPSLTTFDKDNYLCRKFWHRLDDMTFMNRSSVSPLPYLNDGRHYPTRVRQPERDEQVDVNFVAQAPQLPGNQWQKKSSFIVQSRLVSQTSSDTDMQSVDFAQRREGADDPPAPTCFESLPVSVSVAQHNPSPPVQV